MFDSMYGKHFESMYTGSMVGIGAIPFAVWGYVISHQRPPHFEVELNPKILAVMIGESPEDIAEAIEKFCQPDPESRTDTLEGRKLERIGTFLFRVVNGAIYDRIRNNEERKEYWREQKRKAREAKQGQPPSISAPVNPPAVPEKLPDPQPVKSGNVEQALVIYDAYPRKVQRKDALVAIGKALKKMDFEKLLAVTRQYAEAKATADMKFVPHPASWFNGEEFFDDPAMWNLPEVVSGAPRKPSLPERELARLVRQQAEAAECAADKSAVIDMSWMTKKMKPSIQEENEA